MDPTFPISDLLLYKNNQLIAFNKPNGMPVQPDTSGDRSLLELARIYSKGKVFPVHRIDRPSSGVVLFARNQKAAAKLSHQFEERSIEKTYLAVVAQPFPPGEGKLHHYLSRNRGGRKVLASEHAIEDAREAELQYRLLDTSEHLALLEVRPLTGRLHQIRAQLSAMGHPIRGDNKYGFKRGNRDRSIQLHAWKLKFDHPQSGERQEIIASPPADAVWQAFPKIQTL